MSQFSNEFTRVLAVDIASRGLGFALLEGPLALIDWGFCNARDDRDAQCITHVVSMIATFKPDVLVLEDFGTGKSRRPPRVRALADTFSSAADQQGVECYSVSRKCVRSTFPSCHDRYDIADALTEKFPDTVPWCPPRRKIWKSEDPRINIFDALSFAITHLTHARQEGNGPYRKLNLQDPVIDKTEATEQTG